MKKVLAIIFSCLTLICVCGTMTGCSFIDVLNQAVELEDLWASLEEAQDRIEELETENATLRFNAKYPTGLVTESCNLEKVIIERTEVDTEGSVYAVRADGAEVAIVINGGKYNAGQGSLYNIAVWAHNGSSIVINGGEFITGNDVNGEANHAVYAAGGSTIEINGGVFKSTGDASWLLNCQDNNGTIIVKGGTFINFDPSDCISEGEHTNFVADGYGVIVIINNGGTAEEYTEYKVVPESELPSVEEPAPEEPEDF
jgi:hypothetical protein